MLSESPALEINVRKICENTYRVVEKCHEAGISVLGVTKGFSAIPEIVTAMVAGGIDGLADARLENIIEMRDKGFDQSMTLLRIPRLSNVHNVVKYADISINSEISVIQALSQAAKEQGVLHKIILMVDVGDLREGILTENVLMAARKISGLQDIEIIGLGTNMGCFGGILPETENLGLLVYLGKLVENRLGIRLPIISGGGTSTLRLLENGEVPDGVNQLRVGEGILLGTDTTNQRTIPWLHQDAFCLRVEVIEVKDKPSVPIGTIGRDSFGNIPQFVDEGIRKRAILAIGKQDVYIEGIIPADDTMKILGASSDHLIVDITDSEQNIKVGDEIAFSLTYAGLLSVCTSKYVTRVFKEANLCL